VQYRLAGEPQWEASIDLDLIVTPIVEGGKLNLYVTPTTGRNHFHIMKDNKGKLGLFDHSDLVDSTIRHLPEMLGEADGGPVASVDLDSLGADIVFKDVDLPIRVTASGGFLYIDLDAFSIDLVKYLELAGE
jgi:hypothetical protein